MMRLLLFDIDGTLIRTSKVGRQVMKMALEEVIGSAGQIESYPFAGKTDRGIIFDLLTEIGLSDRQINQYLPDVYSRMAKLGKTLFYQDGLFPCAGILELISQLSQRTDTMLGLQTGNIQPTAHIKLDAAGLVASSFLFGAYGSDSAKREELIPFALERATEVSGRKPQLADVIVIGDTPSDIECAKANGVKSIAVATGTYSSTTLAQYDPDILLDDLSDTFKAIDLMVK
jgi:phosphoglycolate phosphatase-like HAD superfamily hydrolase